MPEQSLPRRADLAQLRQQAKELRDALRGGEKGAIERLRRYSQVDAWTVTLSAAQLVIAREHGDMPHGDGMHLPKASLIYEDALPATDVVSGQVLMLDGQLVSTDGEPADRSPLRLTLVSGVRPPRGSSPDRREIVLVCPRETIMATVTRMAGWQVDTSVAAEPIP
jgi:hypothetical protein